MYPIVLYHIDKYNEIQYNTIEMKRQGNKQPIQEKGLSSIEEQSKELIMMVVSIRVMVNQLRANLRQLMNVL